MFWSRQEHKDLFWAGFLAGTIVGGTVGMLLASEVGRGTRKRLELAAQQVRSRFNGSADPDPEEAQEAAQPEPSEERNIETDVE